MQNTARRRRKRKEESVSVDALDAIINAVQNNYMEEWERFRAIEQRAGVGLSFLGVLLGILIIYDGDIEYVFPNIDQTDFKSLLVFIFSFILLICVYLFVKNIVSRSYFRIGAASIEKGAIFGLTFSGVLLSMIIIIQSDFKSLFLFSFIFSVLISVFLLLRSKTFIPYFQMGEVPMELITTLRLTFSGIFLSIIIIFQSNFESMFLSLFIFTLLVSVYYLLKSIISRSYAQIDTNHIVEDDFFFKEVEYIKVDIARSYNEAINQNTETINKKSKECNIGIFASIGAFASLIILYVM